MQFSTNREKNHQPVPFTFFLSCLPPFLQLFGPAPNYILRSPSDILPFTFFLSCLALSPFSTCAACSRHVLRSVMISSLYLYIFLHMPLFSLFPSVCCSSSFTLFRFHSSFFEILLISSLFLYLFLLLCSLFLFLPFPACHRHHILISFLIPASHFHSVILSCTVLLPPFSTLAPFFEILPHLLPFLFTLFLPCVGPISSLVPAPPHI